MAGLRDLVYETLSDAPTLLELGLGEDGLYPNQAPDSPTERRFCVLRWGTGSRRPGTDTTARVFDLQVWAYDRETDFGGIIAILKAVHPLLRGLIGQSTGQGWVLDVSEQGQGPDLWDGVYQAALRYASFNIVASGE